MSLELGDESRCRRCGGKIVLISHPRIISLNTGMWVHKSGARRFVSNHPAEGPTS